MKSLKTIYSFSICCAILVWISCAPFVGADNEDYFPVKQNGKVGFIDKTGKVVISPQFDSALTEDDVTFREDLAAVQIGDKWGYIDKKGKFVIQPKFNFTPSLFHDGLAQVIIKEKIIEKSGELDKSQKYIVREETLGFID